MWRLCRRFCTTTRQCCRHCVSLRFVAGAGAPVRFKVVPYRAQYLANRGLTPCLRIATYFLCLYHCVSDEIVA